MFDGGGRTTFNKMKSFRRAAIDKAKGAKTFGIVLGTLGRQGATPRSCAA